MVHIKPESRRKKGPLFASRWKFLSPFRQGWGWSRSRFCPDSGDGCLGHLPRMRSPQPLHWFWKACGCGCFELRRHNRCVKLGLPKSSGSLLSEAVWTQVSPVARLASGARRSRRSRGVWPSGAEGVNGASQSQETNLLKQKPR